MEAIKFLIFLFIFMTANFSVVKSVFVTLWTPKFVQEDATYKLFVLPTDLTKDTEVSVQFRQASATYTLTNGKIGAIEYGSKERNFGDIKNYNLTMTLLRNVTGNHMHCSTKNISVETKTGNFYNFIQTDKPIYKPGDTVQFRVLTVDKDLLPFHRDSINVTITDPQGRPIYNFQNQAGKYIGVFDDNFTLSTETILGDWMITVVVDRKVNKATSKLFAVQKYTLPSFDAHIDIPELHYLKEVDMMFSIYAKYSFGEYVKGTADVVIRRSSDKHAYYTQTFSSVEKPKVITKNIKSMGIDTLDVLQLEIFLKFTEPQSGIHFNKTIPFFVHADDQHKIVAVHNEKFMPGFPFAVRIMIYNWKNEQLMTYFEQIELTYSYTLENKTSGFITDLGELKNGVYVNEFKVPLEYTALTVDVKFTNSKPYHQEIEKGTVNVGMNTLLVSHAPINPTADDTVKVFVTSDHPLHVIIYAIVTRYGNTDSKQFDCKGQLVCDFDVDMREEMMPHSTIMVYNVKGQKEIYQGKTKVETKDLGDNHLTVELPSTKVKTREEVNMKFTTKARSKVYMLAFDKRLTFLRDGNDIVKDDIMKSVADYDGENKILVDDLSEWHDCTPEEVKRVESGRTYIINQGGTDTVYPDEKDDPNVPNNENPPNPDLPPSKDDLLRQYFPETWIFETIEVGKKSSFQKSYTTPDSMTTWLISAFSVHKDYGLALSPRQDLIVMNEFFVQMNLPYSIRYTEVFKLEILVFNYIDTKESLSVDLKLNNIHDGMEFQFVDYSSDCTPSYHDGTSATSKVSVEANGMSTVHFYIRSNPLNNTFDDTQQKLMTIDVEAIAKSSEGRIYRDHVQRKIIIEPVGIKVYMVASNSFKLDGGDEKTFIQHANYSQDLTNVDVVVTGDYLSNSINLYLQYTLYPSNCLLQAQSTFKLNVDTYKYFDTKEMNQSKSLLLRDYQTLLSVLGNSNYTYGYKASFRSEVGDTLAQAMKIGAIPVNKSVVFESLDKVQSFQLSNGTFTFDDFSFVYTMPFFTDADFLPTMRYFAAAYCLIPFVRHRSFIDGRYDEFIEKGFRYLDKDVNRLQVMRYGLSVAAYVYALNNQPEKARNLLLNIEEAFIELEDNKKCYLIETSDTKCDLMHTCFVAMTYIALNDITKVEPIIYYLTGISDYYNYDTKSEYIIFLNQPVADMGSIMNVKDTNLKVTIKNEKSFEKYFQFNNTNMAVPQSLEMPPGSEKVNLIVSGTGFCTITSTFERTVAVPLVDNAFTLTIKPVKFKYSVRIPSSYLIEVCATYNQQQGWKPILTNVIYEIEMPSGYIYDGHSQVPGHDNIRHATIRKEGTAAELYFEDFEADTNYCVMLTVNRKNIVNEPANAGVKVYNFNNKERVSIGFYSFESEGC